MRKVKLRTTRKVRVREVNQATGTLATITTNSTTPADSRAQVPLPKAILGGTAKWRLARWSALLPKIDALEEELQQQSESQLRKRSLSLKYRAKSGEPPLKLLPEAFALVREAGRRTIAMRHYPVQLLGGIAMFHGSIVEMQTGEGKTLTATLALYLQALSGRGAHLATVNDYLAQRDAEWMGPIYKLLGTTVGVVQTQMPQSLRRKAYACDVTYGTSKEFGFDFLRDRLLLRRQGMEQGSALAGVFAGAGQGGGEQPVQRGQFFAVVDEADSVLIDEARTPLIISALPGESQQKEIACYNWAAGVAGQFEDEEHYEYDEEKKKVELTLPGRQLVRALEKPPELDAVGLVNMYQYVERAVKVNRDFLLDRHYVVRDGEIVIVDEFTGRLSEGRKWRAGIHQAIEAKEGVEVTVDTGQAARITVQDYFQRYDHLAGMTGTAASSARELRRIYRLRTIAIPTNRPPRRSRQPNRVFGTSEEKWQAIVAEVRELNALGRPVLIGTRSIDKSETLSRMLLGAGIDHQVLNARHIASEAQIVAQAGQGGRVTVSTNMAGRGTDIKLGGGVDDLGGLHVICTEMHDSARIDRQLIGRCGRQGDPGSFRQYLSLDDDVLETGLGLYRSRRLKAIGERIRGSSGQYFRLFRRAQRRVERRHFRDRMTLMHYEKQRKKMHREMGQDAYLDSPD